MKICFFEDQKRAQLYPFTLTRPVDQIRIGISTLKEKWLLALKPESAFRITHPLIANAYHDLDSYFPSEKESVVFINSRALPSENLIHIIKNLKPEHSVSHPDGTLIATYSAKPERQEIDLEQEEMLISRPWDIVEYNGEQIRYDFNALDLQDNRNIMEQPENQILIRGEFPVYIHPTAKIEPSVTILADEGPVYIGPHATVMAGSILRRGLAVCEHAQIRTQSQIHLNTTIGPWCKVGGEVKNVVFFGYSNKSHAGYLGNSVVGEWVNLGADTNGSNMKNNYSNVRLQTGPGVEPIDSGLMYSGQMIGDHTKTAINTMMNTGSVLGPFSNIAVGGFPPKFIPSFSWLTPHGLEKYALKKAIPTMSTVMGRRNMKLTDEMIDLYKAIHEDETALLK